MVILGLTLNLKISGRKAEIFGVKVEKSGRKKRKICKIRPFLGIALNGPFKR